MGSHVISTEKSGKGGGGYIGTNNTVNAFKLRFSFLSWSDLKRAENPSYFCEKAIENLNDFEEICKFKIWIITDARRQTDLSYFRSNYPNQVKTIRVKAEDSVREARNWKFTSGKLHFYLKI
jgi:phosphomevalonate kinase